MIRNETMHTDLRIKKEDLDASPSLLFIKVEASR